MQKEVKKGWCNPDLSSFGDLCKAPQERPLQAAVLFLCNLAKEEDTCTQYQIYHLFLGFGGFFWKSFIQKWSSATRYQKSRRESWRQISITQFQSGHPRSVSACESMKNGDNLPLLFSEIRFWIMTRKQFLQEQMRSTWTMAVDPKEDLPGSRKRCQSSGFYRPGSSHIWVLSRPTAGTHTAEQPITSGINRLIHFALLSHWTSTAKVWCPDEQEIAHCDPKHLVRKCSQESTQINKEINAFFYPREHDSSRPQRTNNFFLAI